jgi:hypothetical protein
MRRWLTSPPCPREARTAGNNRVRAKLASLLAKYLDTQWQLFVETPMRSTGLELEIVSAAFMIKAGRLLPGDHSDSICVGNLQPYLVLVSRYLGLLDVCRPFDYHSEWLAAARQPAETRGLSWLRCGHIWKMGGKC